MISIDDHPPADPSSSHHHQQQKKQQQQNPHDLKVSDIDLKSADADPDDTNNPLPNFSIREYVFSLRSKDIACNWPFSPKSLHICLKHGVDNVLPTFQSLDSLRNNSSLTRLSLENRLTDEELCSFDGKPTNDQVKPNGELLSANSIVLKGDKESQFHPQPESGRTKSKDKPPSFSQKTEYASAHTINKKGRLVVKVNSGAEQFAPISESMASKVCPVCKIFSSSSNTTLNAHIDQCLAGEGTMKWTVTSKVIVKHKVKPRKMRLMVDIYKTAQHCTVEDLDRRNGTSWATKSKFPAQEFQFQGEEERDEPQTTTINPVVGDNEGDVYVDTNGTKVRILSVPKAGLSDNLGGRKLLQGVKGSKMIIGKKKHNIHKKKHHKKDLKVAPNARKMCSPKPQIVDGQAKGGEGEEVGMTENCSKDELGRETMKVIDRGIIRPPWACSKRTGLSKKINSKNQKVEISHKKNDLVVENDKSSSECELGTPQSLSNFVSSSSRSRKRMRISLSLAKQPLSRMVEFRKEGARIPAHDDDGGGGDDDDDDCEGSLNACPSEHSDDADTRLKGSNFSSLSKNLSLAGAKLNFKRKFAAVEKSRIKSLKRKFAAVEKSSIKSVDEPSQDSLKERSGMEEHMATKMKESTRSHASKSSNEESSMGFQTGNVDELESIRNETSLSIPAPSFMGLSTSFDPEFSKQECIDMYQDQICSTNRAPNDVEKQENYFQNVDPIPIPGPPGSFLPASPGGEMVSEQQIQETTVLSSENQHHHDTMDQDSMSNSPVSTVSNSRSTSAQEEAYKKPFLNGNVGYTERGQSNNSFKIGQPCCCTRKEVALNYQDSYLMKQPIESNLSTPSSLSFRTETLSLSNYPTSPAPDSAATPSKPVLRLMGKNLTVANKTDEEDASLSLQYSRPPVQSGQQHPHPPAIINQYQNRFESHHLNAHPFNHMSSHVDSRPVHGGFMAPVDRYGHDDSYLALGPMMHQARSHHGHNVLDSHAYSERNVYNAASRSRSVNEFIIINDSPENEADDSLRKEFYEGNQAHMNPLYTMYPSYGGGGGGGSSMFRGSSFQTSLASRDHRGGKWNTGSSTAYYPPSYP